MCELEHEVVRKPIGVATNCLRQDARLYVVQLGKIRIEDHATFVDVPEGVVDRVMAKKESYRIGRQRITLELA